MRSTPLILVAVVLLGYLVVSAATREWSILVYAAPVLFGGLPVVRGVLAHFGFTVAESPDGLRLRHGLLETRSQTVPPGRVQAVRLTEPLLWQSRGWCRLEVDVAGYVGSGQEHVSVLCPVLHREDAIRLLTRVLPLVDVDAVPLTGVPSAAVWVDPLGWRALGVGTDERVLVSRHGRFTRVTDVVLHEKVQSVRLSQGPIQRRLGLASLHLDTTPGPVRATAAHRDAAQARALLDAEVFLARAARAVAVPDRWMVPPGHPEAPTVTP